jgi:hypothetical protein
MTKRSHRGEFGLTRIDRMLHSILVGGVRVAAGHQVGRRRLPWLLGGLIVPRPMGVSRDVKPPMKPSVLYNQTTV